MPLAGTDGLGEKVGPPQVFLEREKELSMLEKRRGMAESGQ